MQIENQTMMRKPHILIVLLVALLGALIVAGLLSGCGENLTPLPDPVPYGDTTPPALACVPNLDGRLDAHELTPAVGVPLRYRVTPSGQTRQVDLKGQLTGAGKQIWDLSSDPSVDAEVQLSAQAASGFWFGGHFPPDAIAVPADVGGRTYGIYQHDSAGFWLLGIASATENPVEGQTLLIYNDRIALFLFPLEPGKTWTSTATVTNGVLRGLPYAAKDTYTMKVEAQGELKLPDLIFESALQVSAHVILQSAIGTSVTQRQVYWLFECFGEVARATSAPDEPNQNFTEAQEIRRLGL